MRTHVLLLVLVSGCSLYFGQSAPGDDSPLPDARVSYDGGSQWPGDGGPPWLDAPGPIDASTAGQVARCEDSQLFFAAPDDGLGEAPGHGAGRLFGRCPGACRSAVVACTEPGCQNATAALCYGAASPGATCPLEGATCEGSSAIECPEATSCQASVPGSTCACVNGRYRCKQVTPAAATQAAIVGRWRGIVTPPSFAAPYPITLWIYPDGTYWPDAPAEHTSAFFYGGDGPSPNRHITIQSTVDTVGSYADLTIDFGFSPPNHAAVSGLVVNANNLRFTFYASWFDCGQPFDVNLSRY